MGGVPVVDDHQNEKGVEGIQDVVEVVELEVIPVVSEQSTTASMSSQSPPIVEVDNQSTLNTWSSRICVERTGWLRGLVSGGHG